ncbi:MAG: replication-relaxation family protein [Dehalococcoidia bacterium]
MNDEQETRYVLTELGMRYLAAQTGVPAATFARHGGVTFIGRDESDAGRVPRHREHAIGVNRFFTRLAEDARRSGWRLAEWRNEAESTRRFVTQAGRTSWIRPDGSGVLVRGTECRPFLLEYDRGTLDAGDYRAKFEGYRRYYAGREWEGDFPSEPVLLFVCSDDRAEERVARAARSVAPDLPMLLTSEWRYLSGSGDGAGALGPVLGEARNRRGRGRTFRAGRGSNGEPAGDGG